MNNVRGLKNTLGLIEGKLDAMETKENDNQALQEDRFNASMKKMNDDANSLKTVIGSGFKEMNEEEVIRKKE
jgi:phage host-nuclease inhibitor protein Gam